MIIKIQNEQGKILAKEKDIQSHIISYFQSLYKSDGANISQNFLMESPRQLHRKSMEILQGQLRKRRS